MSTTAVVLLLLLVGAGGYIAYSQGLFNQVKTGSTVNPGGGPTCLNNYQAPSGFICVNSATLTFALNDGVSNTAGAIGTATLTVYNTDGSGTGDSGSTSSSGAFTTNNKYSTGQQLIVKISKSSYVNIFQKLTVPPALASASPPTNLQVPIYDTTRGSWTNTVVGNPGGTTISTGQKYFFNRQATAQTSLQLQWSLSESTQNAGYVDSFDPFNQLTQHLVMQADDGGAATITFANCQYTSKISTTTYCFWIIPSGVTPKYSQDGVTLAGWSVAATGATQRYDSNSNTAIGGQYGFAPTVNIGSLVASSSAATVSYKLYYDADPVFWINGPVATTATGLAPGQAQNTLGPNAVQSGSTFTILFQY